MGVTQAIFDPYFKKDRQTRVINSDLKDHRDFLMECFHLLIDYV